MTELEVKAEEYIDANCICDELNEKGCNYKCRTCPLKNAFKSGYEQGAKDIDVLTKENAGLKAQIEKMKCCQNCKNTRYDENGISYCKLNHKDTNLIKCNDMNEWELAE